MWGPPTGESDSSSWPTPLVGWSNDHEDVSQWDARRERQKARGINGNGMGEPLGVAVRRWPTPTAADAKSSGAAAYDTGHSGTTLCDSTEREASGTNLKLNPDWAEALMGLPIGWTRPGGPNHAEQHSTPGSHPGSSAAPEGTDPDSGCG
jgi:hypothetical protein